MPHETTQSTVRSEGGPFPDDHAKGGAWEFDPSTEEIDVSKELAVFLGESSIGRISMREFVKRWVHHDDQLTIWNGFASLLTGNESCATDCRMIDRQGMIKNTIHIGQAVKDETGRTRKITGIVWDITPRIERENELKEREPFYRSLFDRSDDGIAIVEGDEFVKVNRRMIELFAAVSETELLGLHPWDIAPKTQPSKESSETLLREIMEHAPDTEFSRRVDLRSRRLDGSEFDAVISVTQVLILGKQCFIMLLRDITVRKNEEKLSEDYRAYLYVLAEIRKVFFRRSKQEIIQTAITCLAHHFRFAKVWYGEILVDCVHPALHAGEARHYVDLVALPLYTRPGDAEFPLALAIRNDCTVSLDNIEDLPSFAPWKDFVQESGVRSVFSMPLEIDGKPEGGIVLYSTANARFDTATTDYLQNIVREIGRLISEKRFWEKQESVLKHAKERAEHAAQEKGRFLANMSHEIRTPMTAILGYTEIFTDPNTTPESRNESAFIVRNNAEFLLQILNDVLDFSKIEADKLKIEIRQTDVERLLDEIVLLYDHRAKEKGLEFTLTNSTPFPKSIPTDPFRLKQILLNIISNAIKFTDRGSVHINLSWSAYGKDRSMGRFQVDVKDTGIGMRPQTLDSIFVPFLQEDSSTTRKFGGTGLGLPISQRLVKMLGGEIQAVSEPEKGSTFSVILPMIIDDDVPWIDKTDLSRVKKTRGFQTVDAEQKDRKPLKNVQILLAEDAEDTRRLFNLILSKAGADMTLAENGAEALDAGLARWKDGRPFDLILMDMQMPVMDGYTAVNELRAGGYDAPIVALTAHALCDETKRCQVAGCDDCITKPILRDDLIAAILKVLKK